MKYLKIISYKNLTPNDLRKAVNIVKSNYIFNLETSSQLTSFFGNDFLWSRENSLINLDNHLKYWLKLTNFKEIINYLSKDKFTLIAYTCK